MEWLTREQARERLGIGLRTLDRLIAEGKLPAYKVGSRLVRIRDTDIDAYMAGQLVVPEKAKPIKLRPCGYVPGMKVV